jgi:hypothetical protein
MDEAGSRAERIKYLIEVLRLCWLTLLAIGSGTLGILLGELNFVRMLFSALGCAAVGFLNLVTIAIDASVRDLLDERGEE